MKADKMLDISVIVCAYTEERWEDIVVVVESLRQQTVPPCEIIMVIDHNTRLYKRAQANIHGAIIVENSEARGLSGARNSGLAIAQGSLIAFLDDDAVAEPDWLEHLIQCFDDPQVLGVGGNVAPDWLNKRPVWFPEEFYWVVGCSYLGLPDKLSVVRNPYGGCTCFRREIFEIVGGFRSGIGRVGTRPMGGEETELCIRAKQQWPEKIFLYQPLARIHHRIPLRRANWHYFRSRCYAEGLSKALITRYVGAKDCLTSERSYTLHTLPFGVMRGLKDGLFHFEQGGFMKAGAIVCGLVVTIAGYVVGTITQQVALQTVTGFKRGLKQSLRSHDS